MEGVADDDRQAAFDRRRHGLRMHHLGAEIGQFAGLVVTEAVQLHRLGHHPRIGRQHPVHVGPDVQFIGVEQRGEDRPGVIAAVAAQGGDAVLAVTGDEAGGHHPGLRMGLAPVRQPLRAALPVHIHAQFTVAHHQHLARIKHRAILAQGAQVFTQQLCRTDLAQALHPLQHFGRQATDHTQRRQQLGQFLETLVQPLHGRPGMLAQQGHRRAAVARAQCMPALAPVRAARPGAGRLGQFDQRVGHPLHRRDHGDLQRFLARQQQLGHVAVALGVGHRSAAELVHHGARGRGRFDGGELGGCCRRRHGGPRWLRPRVHQVAGRPAP